MLSAATLFHACPFSTSICVHRTKAASASSGWSYSKTEGLSVSAFADHGFDYLLNAHEHVPGYEVAFVADGYAGLAVDVKSAPSVLRVKTKPEIYVHRRASLEH